MFNQNSTNTIPIPAQTVLFNNDGVQDPSLHGDGVQIPIILLFFIR